VERLGAVAHGDGNLLHTVEVLIGAAEMHEDVAAVARDREALVVAVDVTVQALAGVRAHIEGEVPVLVDVAPNLRAVKRRVELEQGQARELVIGLETEEAEVDLQKRFEEEINLAGDVEHGDRIKVVGLEVRRDFAEPNLVVVVEIVEEEINARGDAALDT